MIMVSAESIGEAENNANIEMDKIAKWARDNKIKEEKSKVMLLTRRKKRNSKRLRCI
jgi:hypothetical protein